MLQLELQPEVESRLIAEAHSRGLSIDRYIESLVAPPVTDEPRTPERQLQIEAAIDRIRELRQGMTTGGQTIKDLINEGRKY